MLLAAGLAVIVLTIPFEFGKVSSTYSAYSETFSYLRYILAVLIAIPTVIYSAKLLRKTGMRFFVLPCFTIALSFMATGMLFSMTIETDKSPVFLKATYDGNVHYMDLSLMENGTYLLDNQNSPYGGELHRGVFKMVDDTIILDKDISLGAYSMTDRCVIVSPDSIRFYIDKGDELSAEYFVVLSQLTNF